MNYIESWTKLLVVLLVDAITGWLGYARVLDSQAVVAVLSASLGYVFGNGHGIISAQRALQQQMQNGGNEGSKQ